VQFGRGAGGQHLACIHRHQPVEAFGLLHVGGGDDHAHGAAFAADTVDQVPELLARQRVDAGRRFVEDQQVGVVDQGAAEPEFLLHAARELARRARQEGLQAGAGGQLVDALAALCGVVAEQATEELQVLLDRQRRVEVASQTLRHVGDARANAVAVALARHVAAQHLQATLLQLARAGKQRQQARLADAVGTDQADHATGRDRQRDVVERDSLAIA
jgi:hypothetical protein